MARTLPWLTSEPVQTAKPPPTKRRKLLHPTSDSESNNTTSNSRRKPKRDVLQAGNRTPSTSPPPEPPSQHSMRPGVDADDGYIMVEDEFLATAQLYTKHLHHAEYARLKHLARTRQSHLSENEISRPISTTEMRDELRRRKTTEARTKKINTGLDPLLHSKKPEAAKPHGDESSASDFEAPKDDDPWQGTQLQRFMTVSPRKERGLMGLQGVVSHTRAAAGFAAPDRSGESRSPSSRKKVVNNRRRPVPEPETDDEDSDDLDLPTARGSTMPPTPRHTQRPPSPTPAGKSHPLGNSILGRRLPTANPAPPNSLFSKPTTTTKPPNRRSFLDLHPLPNPSSTTTHIKSEPSPISKPRTQVSSPPSSPDIKAEPLPQAKGSSLLQQRLKAHREKAERERRGRAVLEIPVFLV